MLRTVLTGSISSWQQLSTLFLQHFQVTRRFAIPLALLENVKQKKGEALKLYINCFNKMSNFVTWSPDARVLAHFTNRVLPETPFWDELQQQECRSVREFYRKTSKFLKLEDSKEAMRKAEWAATTKKNNQGEAADDKRKDKKRREEKTSGWIAQKRKRMGL